MGVKIIKKKIVEGYSISTARMDDIEKNEFFAGMKENIEYDINSDYQYWQVRLQYDDSKRVHIVIEPVEEIDKCDGISSDTIYKYSYGDVFGEDPYPGCSEDDYNAVQEEVRNEYNKLSKEIIPKLAKEWGFRKSI
jgi:hypothetical protein